MKRIETLISVYKKKKTVNIADYFSNIVNSHIANYFMEKQTVHIVDNFFEIQPSQSGFVFVTLIKNKENL